MYEVDDENLNTPVIMGDYTDYRVESAYDTDFAYTKFEEGNCLENTR